MSTDKSAYGIGEPVIITASLTNNALITCSFSSKASDPIQFIIMDWSLDSVYESEFHKNITAFSLSGGESLERTFIWNQVDTINVLPWNQTFGYGNRTYVPGTSRISAFIPNADPTLYYLQHPLFEAWANITTTSD